MVGEGKPFSAFNSALALSFPSLSPRLCQSLAVSTRLKECRAAVLTPNAQHTHCVNSAMHLTNATDRTCLQAATETETENRLADDGGKKGWDELREQQETCLLPVWHREASDLVLCHNLEGWGVVGGGGGAQEEGDVSTSVADSCWCTAETSTTVIVKQLSSNNFFFFFLKSLLWGSAM